MNLETRSALTKALQQQVSILAEDLRGQLQMEGPAQDRARALHAEEKVGGDFLVWTDLLARRAAVLWALKTVYVRVLEDRGLALPRRLVEPREVKVESEELFRQLAPHLGATSYLDWVFRDLGHERGGLPELFAPQPAEVVRPSDAVSQGLVDFWRERDANTGALRWRFDEETFDGALMGDLYQDLDPVVKARYALLQTPDFVLEFILDRTLTPAIAEWGVEAVRVLDPACGSGHFLLAAFRRLVAGMREKFPDRPVQSVVADCLERVVGIDLNDYACGLARSRLVMTALELMGERDLGQASGLHPQVYWSDALEQVERDEVRTGDLFEEFAEKPRASLTRPEVAARLRPLLKARFHVVVGNPPYITEKNPLQREYHREKVGKERRYVSAAGKYSLGAPFTERMFQLACNGGWVGQITANSFMKREFGKALIEKVLPKEDLFLVVDTSGAYIPGHGTPTVLLFGRHRRAQRTTVDVVMGKRGEPGVPADPAQGKVWSSIVEGWATPGYESEFVSTAQVARGTLNAHPWSIGGGGAAELKVAIDGRGVPLSSVVSSIGFASFPGADDVFILSESAANRLGVPSGLVRWFVPGEVVRDWSIHPGQSAIAPYGEDFALLGLEELGRGAAHFWRYRSVVLGTSDFGGLSRGQQGDVPWSWYRWQADRYRTPLSITFAEVATHNHFALDRGGKVFKQTAPVIKLPPEATESEHLALLGQLNSSVAEFWMKQVYQAKGGDSLGDGGRVAGEGWEERYQRDGTKLKSFPGAAAKSADLSALAGAIAQLADERVADSAETTADSVAGAGTSALRIALQAQQSRDRERLYRMVGLQEELDWLNYRLYGVEEDAPVRAPSEVPPLHPGHRAFELILAQADAERRAALARGEDPDEAPTAWFERHGWQPALSLSAIEDQSERAVVADRIARIGRNPKLALIEKATFKRRWYRPDYEAEQRAALELFLSDAIEEWARSKGRPFTLRQLAVALQDSPAVMAVAEVLIGRADYDLETILSERLQVESVPNVKHHVFKASGLAKRAVWERTWELQHREDAGEKVTPPVPPKYVSADYLKADYWKLRGALDVPKERFIAFTEVPVRDQAERLYGWAGWTPGQRAKVLLELDERCEEEGLPIEERVGVLYGAWSLLPYLRWDDKALSAEVGSIIESLVGPQGVTDAMLGAWADRVPKPGAASRRRKLSAG